MFPAHKMIKKFALAGLVVVLASCGGGGSATGGLTEFSVVPESWELTGGTGNTSCAVDLSNPPEVSVTVVGGTPPYRVVNSVPQWLAVSATTLTDKNPTFQVIATGGCGDDMGILVLDHQSRSVNFTFTFTAGEELVVDDSTL